MQARKEAIEERLQQIRASSPGSLIRELWEEHHGVMCAGVYWDRYSGLPCCLLDCKQDLSDMQHDHRKVLDKSASVLVILQPVESEEVHGVGTRMRQYEKLCCAGLDMLSDIAECIGGHSLVSVCRLLAEDHSGWSGELSALTPSCSIT